MELATKDDLAESRAMVLKDLAEAKVQLIKWTVGSMFAAIGLFATITKPLRMTNESPRKMASAVSSHCRS